MLWIEMGPNILDVDSKEEKDTWRPVLEFSFSFIILIRWKPLQESVAFLFVFVQTSPKPFGFGLVCYANCWEQESGLGIHLVQPIRPRSGSISAWQFCIHCPFSPPTNSIVVARLLHHTYLSTDRISNVSIQFCHPAAAADAVVSMSSPIVWQTSLSNKPIPAIASNTRSSCNSP